MLLVGLIAITIGGTIIYIVINKLEDEWKNKNGLVLRNLNL
jgi:hypothetical protein